MPVDLAELEDSAPPASQDVVVEEQGNGGDGGYARSIALLDIEGGSTEFAISNDVVVAASAASSPLKIMVNALDPITKRTPAANERRLIIDAPPDIATATAKSVVDYVRGSLPRPNFPLSLVPMGSAIYAQIMGEGNDDIWKQPALTQVDPFTPSSVPRFLYRLDTSGDAKLRDIPAGVSVLEVNPKKFIINVLVRQPDGSMVRGVFGMHKDTRVLPINRENWAMFSFIKAKTDGHFRSSQGVTSDAICETIDFSLTCNKLPGKSIILRRTHQGSEFHVTGFDSTYYQDWNLYRNLLTTDNSDGMINLTVERADIEPSWSVVVSGIILGLSIALLGVFYWRDNKEMDTLIASTMDNKTLPCRTRWGQLANIKLMLLAGMIISLFFLTLGPSFATVMITHAVAWSMLAVLFITYFRRQQSTSTSLFTHSSWLVVPLLLLSFHAADMFLSKCNDISTYDHTPLLFAVAALALMTLADTAHTKRVSAYLNNPTVVDFTDSDTVQAIASQYPNIPRIADMIEAKKRSYEVSKKPKIPVGSPPTAAPPASRTPPPPAPPQLRNSSPSVIMRTQRKMRVRDITPQQPQRQPDFSQTMGIPPEGRVMDRPAGRVMGRPAGDVMGRPAGDVTSVAVEQAGETKEGGSL